MTTRHWLPLAAALGFIPFVACGGDEKKNNSTPIEEDGGDDAGTGGKAAAGGASAGGASTGGEDAGAGGAAAGGAGAGGAAAGGADAGSSDGGEQGDGSPCNDTLRCLLSYPEVPHPKENPAADDKAMLGKILFWEEQIGELGTMACGTCHRGASGGSDPRAAMAGAVLLGPGPTFVDVAGGAADDIHGGQGVPSCTHETSGAPVIVDAKVQVTGRKPPTYLDAMFAKQIFWDGRAGFCQPADGTDGCFYDPDVPGAGPLIKSAVDPVTGVIAGGALEAQAVGPPVNSVEMACASQTWPDIHGVLRTATPLGLAKSIPPDMAQFITDNGTSYPRMFEAVFGDDAKVAPSDPDDVINTRRIAFAIATHERRLTSDQTPWDRWNTGDDDAMTENQVQGFRLFMGKAQCSQCHTPPLFTDNDFHYLGFVRPEWDEGRKVKTGLATDLAKAKTPTLRNVGLREAGGLLKSGAGPGHDLTTVMTMYNQGGAFRTEPEILAIQDARVVPLNLSQDEMDAIVDFMKNGLTDPRVKAETTPFDRPHLSTEVN